MGAEAPLEDHVRTRSLGKQPPKAQREHDSDEQAAWGVPAHGEPRWPASLALLAAIGLYVTLPEKLTFGPIWLIPALELVLLVPLSITAPRRHGNESTWQRIAAVALIAIVNAANVASLVLLIHILLGGGKVGRREVPGQQLLVGAAQIWMTNVIVFALWFWELDRGGPDDRSEPGHRAPDFLFPQMVTPDCTTKHWTPSFVDYLYVSFTNATAFSPTDTMPLTPWAKLLMLFQALASLLTIALVAARAVNILG